MEVGRWSKNSCGASTSGSFGAFEDLEGKLHKTHAELAAQKSGRLLSRVS